jgi:hypothetical protein
MPSTSRPPQLERRRSGLPSARSPLTDHRVVEWQEVDGRCRPATRSGAATATPVWTWCGQPASQLRPPGGRVASAAGLPGRPAPTSTTVRAENRRSPPRPATATALAAGRPGWPGAPLAGCRRPRTGRETPRRMPSTPAAAAAGELLAETRRGAGAWLTCRRLNGHCLRRRSDGEAGCHGPRDSRSAPQGPWCPRSELEHHHPRSAPWRACRPSVACVAAAPV